MREFFDGSADLFMPLFLVDSVLRKLALVTVLIGFENASPIERWTARIVGSMSSSFHNADKRTHQKIVLTGLLSCAVFVVISCFASEQRHNNRVFIKADKLVRTAGNLTPAK